MSVRIEIDNQASVFTCLDLITGKVVLNVDRHSQETVSSINVKLEGVSKTRLSVPAHGEPEHSKDRKIHCEVHKLLYIVQTVFPPPEIQKQQKGGLETGYTLSAGTHTYPFKLRIPVNNACRPFDSVFSKLSLEQGGVLYAKDAEHHTKNTLPPSLHSLPGGVNGEGGNIRYYIKVTVNRPKFYLTNIRKEAAFAFLPIDPPRQVAQGEIFARREHLLRFPVVTQSMPKKKGFWGGKSKKSDIPPPSFPVEEPRFTIEARLPSPPVLVPKEPLGLRIIMVKLAPFKTPVVLKQIQLRLFMTTIITAQKYSKKVALTIPLFNTSTDWRLGMPIPYIFGPTDAPPGVPLEADKRIWEGWTLPENICPSFRTCNITRSYQLEITLGVSLGDSRAIVDQITLLIPLEVFTGFKPPEKLLALATIRPTQQKFLPRQHSHQHLRANSNPSTSSPTEPPHLPRPTSATFPLKTHPLDNLKPNTSSSLQVPYPQAYRTNGYDPSPLHSPTSPTFPATPQSPSGLHDEKGTGVWLPVNVQQAVLDAPPTYEDTVLRDLDDVDVTVADGPRREYPLQPAYFEGATGEDFGDGDRKRMSRLFGGG